jgi:hypothetical protein
MRPGVAPRPGATGSASAISARHRRRPRRPTPDDCAWSGASPARRRSQHPGEPPHPGLNPRARPRRGPAVKAGPRPFSRFGRGVGSAHWGRLRSRGLHLDGPPADLRTQSPGSGCSSCCRRRRSLRWRGRAAGCRTTASCICASSIRSSTATARCSTPASGSRRRPARSGSACWSSSPGCRAWRCRGRRYSSASR